MTDRCGNCALFGKACALESDDSDDWCVAWVDRDLLVRLIAELETEKTDD